MDDFQLTAIIAKAISTCAVEHRDSGLSISSEQATYVAKVVIIALTQAGMAITPSETAANDD